MRGLRGGDVGGNEAVRADGGAGGRNDGGRPGVGAGASDMEAIPQGAERGQR